jgi:hypothetical protein
MSRRNVPSFVPSATKRPIWRADLERSARARAQRGARLSVVRMGSLMQVEQVMSQLESQGDIGRSEDDAEGVEDDLSSGLGLDADLDLADFDVPDNDRCASITMPGRGAGDEGGDGVSSASGYHFAGFEIVVSGTTCAVPVPEWCTMVPRTPDGRECLVELAARIWALNCVARWLTEERGAYLLTGSPWDLGCDALAEAEDGKAPITQKAFLAHVVSARRTQMSESAFSRYIRTAQIAWPDGSCAVASLFDRAAREAWAAQAVRQYVAKQQGGALDSTWLETCESVTIPKTTQHKRRLTHAKVTSLDFAQFIQRVNIMAGTKWKNVIARYRHEMLGG